MPNAGLISAPSLSCAAGQQAFETIDAGGGHGVFFHQVLEGMRGKAKDEEMKLVLIQLGEFLMGSPESEKDRISSEENQHRVRITKPYYFATTEVTQKQWASVMGTTPWMGEKEGPDFAATYVSWDDAQEYCRKLSAKEGVTYRLPTEAEWEYACRAGSQGMYGFGNSATGLNAYAWFAESEYDVDAKYAHEVGRKRPNALGLYDMHRNVREWCADWYDAYHYKNSRVSDPKGPGTGQYRVYRGGSWDDYARYCRSAYRVRFSPDFRDYCLGFRVAAVRVIEP